MRALITGSEGFIGRHLTAELRANGYEVIGGDISSGADELLDITDLSALCFLLSELRPELIINLAGQANVGLSWKQPQTTVELNTVGFLNLAEAVKDFDRSIRIIAIGSADEYGRLGDRGVSVTEETPLSPANPYSVSKYAQELFAEMYVKNSGLDICCVRLFNLSGAGQGRGFMIPDFASGIAEIEAGRRDFLPVGNLESARDFTHVKDACRALRLIAEKGRTGGIYNICSGRAYKAQEILDRLVSMARVPVEVRPDPARMRPSDTPVICGDHSKLTAHTGWEPRLGIDDILSDVLEYWRGGKA
ncbi:MAG: GDP-mannose 4,6-dehydratase [Ruminococcus sp.]|nr:GDP-mannose 4,6-dehydratase [Ruminococcus sp.]